MCSVAQVPPVGTECRATAGGEAGWQRMWNWAGAANVKNSEGISRQGARRLSAFNILLVATVSKPPSKTETFGQYRWKMTRTGDAGAAVAYIGVQAATEKWGCE